MPARRRDAQTARLYNVWANFSIDVYLSLKTLFSIFYLTINNYFL